MSVLSFVIHVQMYAIHFVVTDELLTDTLNYQISQVYFPYEKETFMLFFRWYFLRTLRGHTVPFIQISRAPNNC